MNMQGGVEIQKLRGNSMDEMKWKQQLNIVEEILKNAGIEGCYVGPENNNAKKAVSKPHIKLDNIHCRGCWEIIPKSYLFRSHRYCKKCMNTKNNIGDYQMILKEVTGWMENLLKLKSYYNIRMNWNQTSFGKDPVRVKGGILSKKHLLGRVRVKRNAISKYLVYSYILLWMSEKDKNGKKNKKLCDALLMKYKIGKDSRLIACWYMLQYMYARGEKEAAENGRALLKKKFGSNLEKLITNHPFWIPNDQNDDREGLKIMLCEHPLR